jgi:NIPSNAP
MHRRNFLAAAAVSAAPLAAAASPRKAWIELRHFHMRTGDQPERTANFLRNVYLPAAGRVGIGPVAFFGASIGDESPFILQLTSYPSAEAFAAAPEQLAGDKEFRQGFEAYNSQPGLSYIRMENSLLHAFDTMPAVAVPPAGNHSPRVFELRTYESNNVAAGQRKIRMFNEGEAAIFERLGMMPVFFGETVVGRNLPSLTYMLSFESMAARDKLWGAFGADAEWQKLRAQPGYADAEIVSNISNTILHPLEFSPVR